jgi:hypothetical protein
LGDKPHPIKVDAGRSAAITTLIDLSQRDHKPIPSTTHVNLGNEEDNCAS